MSTSTAPRKQGYNRGMRDLMTREQAFAVNMRNPNLCIGARLLYWELNQWVSEDCNVCFRTQKKLAENIGVHRNSVIRWLQDLRDEGLLTDVEQDYGNAYAVLV